MVTIALVRERGFREQSEKLIIIIFNRKLGG
jgi:hypothetical protein